MKRFIHNGKTYFFIAATITVAFFLNTSIIKPSLPNAGIVEADLGEVKPAIIAKEFSDQIPERLMVEPRVFTGSFLSKSSKELLADLGVEYDEKAIIKEIGIPAKYGIGYNQVLVLDPPEVYYKVGDIEGTTTTWKRTVGELIEELKVEKNLEIGEGDIVEPPKETELTRDEPFVLKVTPVEKTITIEKEAIKFKTVIEIDPELLKGKTVIKKKGQAGIQEFTYDIERHLIDGKWLVVKKELIEQKVTKEPIEEIILEGTKIELYGIGKASFYDSKVAAHKTLPFGTLVDVVNVQNGKSVRVRIGDRGPFLPGRVIDLPQTAFAEIASVGQGVVEVRLEKVGE